MKADGLSVFFGSVEWLDNSSYLIAARVAPVNCDDTELPTFDRLYRCTVTGGCSETSIPAARVARSRMGPIAYVLADAPTGYQGKLSIEWNDARFTKDNILQWAGIAWSR